MCSIEGCFGREPKVCKTFDERQIKRRLLSITATLDCHRIFLECDPESHKIITVRYNRRAH